jgi:hypothetical protein
MIRPSAFVYCKQLGDMIRGLRTPMRNAQVGHLSANQPRLLQPSSLNTLSTIRLCSNVWYTRELFTRGGYSRSLFGPVAFSVRTPTTFT